MHKGKTLGRREKLPQLPPEGEEIPLGTRLRTRRWYMGIWLEELAEWVGGYSPSHISQIEVGGVNPSAELIEAICRELQISEDELRNTPRETLLLWIQEGQKQTRRGRHALRVIEGETQTTATNQQLASQQRAAVSGSHSLTRVDSAPEIDPEERLVKPRSCIRCNRQIVYLKDFWPVKVIGKGMMSYCTSCRNELYGYTKQERILDNYPSSLDSEGHAEQAG